MVELFQGTIASPLANTPRQKNEYGRELLQNNLDEKHESRDIEY